MPRRQLPGGVSPFQPQTRPNTFNPLPPEEMVERHGEPALWIREIPTPEVKKGEMAMPDSPAAQGTKGYIHSFQRTQNVELELAQIQAIRGKRIYTQLTPIEKVNRVYILQDADRGGNIDLNVTKVCDNYFEISEDVEYWKSVFINYTIRMYDTKEFLWCNHSTDRILRPPFYPEFITKLHRIMRKRPGETGWTEIPMAQVSHSLVTISVPEVAPAHTEYRIKADMYGAIFVAYRTVDNSMQYPSNIQVEAGDLHVITSPYYHFSEGDIVILTKSESVEKQICSRGSDGFYRLRKTPLVRLDSVHDGKQEIPIDLCVAQGYQKFRIDVPNPPKQVTATYLFNPSFRIHKQLSFSALNNRIQPKEWIFRPDYTTAVLE